MTPSRNPDNRRQSGGRWALGLSIPALGGLSWFIFGWGISWGNALIIVLSAILPAVTCLISGWLLRSWWGMVATAVVYVVVSLFIWILFVVGPGDLQAWTVTFPLAVVLPGLVMAAIGAALRRFSAGRGGQHPSLG